MLARLVVFATVVALASACAGSRDDPPSSSTAPPTPVTTTVPITPLPPAVPTVPADVPMTGPNVRSADEKAPVMPVAATQHTTAGAESFAAFFVRTIDWGFATVDGSYMKHYYARSCASCATLATGMDADRRAGRRYYGGRLTIRGARDAGRDTARQRAIVTVDVLSFEELDRSGKFVTADEAHQGEQFELTLTWRADSWVVANLTLSQ